MKMFKVYGIDSEGFDNSDLDLEYQIDPTKETLETVRQRIADAKFQTTPDKVTLIKAGKDQDEEEEEEVPKENLHQTLSCALNEGDTLRYVLEAFAENSVKINLKVAPDAIKWIANHSEGKEYYRFFVGSANDFKVKYKTNVLAMQIVTLHFFLIQGIFTGQK